MAVSTVKSAGGDYSSLSAWEAAKQAVLSAPEEAECYDFADTTAVTIDGWTTTAANYIRVYTPAAERHDGTVGTGYRLRPTSGAFVIDINEQNVRLEGLELYSDATSMTNVVIVNAAATLDIRISHCILRGGPTTADGAALFVVNDGVLKIWNTIVYDHGFRGIRSSSFSGAGLTIYCYNVTCCDCATATGAQGVFDRDGSAVFVVKNCIGQNPNTALASGAVHFQGTFSAAEFNVSGDATAPGTDALTSATVNFENEAADNFKLDAADTVAKGSGVDLSADANLAFSDDILGTTRSDWSRGAHDFAAAGGVVSGIMDSSIFGGGMVR